MIFATGFSNPEGPVALPDGTLLIVEGGAGCGCVTHVSADGQRNRVIKKTGRPNGLAALGAASPAAVPLPVRYAVEHRSGVNRLTVQLLGEVQRQV